MAWFKNKFNELEQRIAVLEVITRGEISADVVQIPKLFDPVKRAEPVEEIVKVPVEEPVEEIDDGEKIPDEVIDNLYDE